MGAVKRMLHSSELAPEPAMYAKKRSIEEAETMHVHERNVRLEYTGREFQSLAVAIADAEKAWSGKEPQPGAPTNWLDVSALPASPGVTPQRFDIEESEYPSLDETTVHVHYRNLRLEFSHAEWVEFAQGVCGALIEWKS